MSNAYLEDEMYNKDLKEQFIARYPENTQNTYKRIFYYSAPVEEMNGIDLYEFNLNQISEVLKSMNPSTIASVKSVVSIIKAYIDWAIHYRSNNLNPLDIVDTNWERQFVDTTRKMFYTHKEIFEEIIPHCVNAQDAVIIALLFEGASGKEVSELRNLKIGDIDFDAKLVTLTNDKGEQRQIPVSDATLQLIREAANQKEYFKRNGNIAENSRNIRVTSDLIETGYLIKPAKTKVVHVEQVNTHVIYGRLSTISEIFELPNFTVKNIQRSGMIYMAKQILERDGYFDNKDQYFEICERFGVNKFDNHGYETYYWYGMKEYVNTEMIEQLYGESGLS